MPGLDLYQQDFSAMTMHKDLWVTFCIVKNRTYNDPIIILSEDVCDNALSTIEKFCNQLELPFSEGDLAWKSCKMDKNELPNWHEVKEYDKVRVWDTNTLQSSCFQKQHEYELNSEGEPTFSEIIDPKDRQLVQKAYLDNLPYFQLFIQQIKNL